MRQTEKIQNKAIKISATDEMFSKLIIRPISLLSRFHWKVFSDNMHFLFIGIELRCGPKAIRSRGGGGQLPLRKFKSNFFFFFLHSNFTFSNSFIS